MSERFTHKLIQPEKVSDLIQAHKAKVAQVLEFGRKHVEQHPEVAEAALKAPLDELYALRFILSSKTEDAAEASRNLVETLEWRAKHAADLDKSSERFNAFGEKFKRYSHVAPIGYLGDLHPVVVVRAGRTRTKTFFEMGGTTEDMIHLNLLNNEYIFRLCDKKTRESGFLCKQVAVIDLEGFSMFHYDPKFSKVIGKSSALSATYYPQLLGKTIIINMPVTFRLIYKAMSVFMPASTIEKQALCPANTLKRSATECPFLSKFSNGISIMPPFLGGTGPMLPEFELNEKDY